MQYVDYRDSIVGRIGVVEEDGYIVEILINEEARTAKNESTILIDEAFKQLDEYFKGSRKVFNLKIKFKGTEFQKRVWDELYKIPYGETRCYQDIAILIGNYKASRAVGMANNKNPIPIILPCHRVLGKNGSLVGYAMGLEMKQMLLDLERKYK